jgi:hypothetical protein
MLFRIDSKFDESNRLVDAIGMIQSVHYYQITKQKGDCNVLLQTEIINMIERNNADEQTR